MTGNIEMLLDGYRLRKAVGKLGNPCLCALVEFTLKGCVGGTGSCRKDEREFVAEALSRELLKV